MDWKQSVLVSRPVANGRLHVGRDAPTSWVLQGSSSSRSLFLKRTNVKVNDADCAGCTAAAIGMIVGDFSAGRCSG